MRTLVLLAGLGQIGLALASLFVPAVLQWSKDTARMRPITRQIFTTYAVYIWATNLLMGLLSLLHPDWLLDGAPLARAVAALLLVELVAGYGLQLLEPSARVRLRAWGLMVAGTLAAHFFTLAGPAGFRMLSLIGAILLGMKAVVAVNRTPEETPLSLPRWLAFTLAWPGMQPGVFRQRALRPLPGWGKYALQGLAALAAGAAFIFLSRFLWGRTASLLEATVPFFIGASLTVHFGFFNLATALWRRLGFDCGALFQNPFAASNLGDFWARRWNIGFGEMTAVAAYQPLKRNFPPWVRLMGAFGFSGLLHEAAISLPVNAGYGGPLAYFLLHGALVALERWMADKGIRLGAGWGFLWIVFWLVAPLPILFHRAFLAGVVWPLIGVGQ
jgi:hypothetical protein